MNRRRFIGMLAALPATRLVPNWPTRPIPHSDLWACPAATPITDRARFLELIEYEGTVWRPAPLMVSYEQARALAEWFPSAPLRSVEFEYAEY